MKDIEYDEFGAKIFVSKSKTDQLREGNTVFISRTRTICCPVFWLQKYLNLTKLTSTPEAFLFCRLLFKTKTGHKVGGHLLIFYSTARTSFTMHISKLADEGMYSLYSLRSGGASEAANNGVSDRLMSKHAGRWSSNTSRNTYINDNHDKRYKISRSLGI